MKTRVIMCQNTFIPDIIAIVKQTTLRKNARCAPGDTLVFRKWIGKPRQKGSKQVTFGTAKCVSVTPIILYKTYVAIYFARCVARIESANMMESFAKQDGFPSYSALIDWFRKNHPESDDEWEMDLIYWGDTFRSAEARP